MSQTPHNKSLMRFLPISLRRLLASVMFAAVVLPVVPPLVSPARANPVGDAMGDVIDMIFDIMDFDPHYGILPLALDILPARGDWCIGPIMIYGYCLPFKYNMCKIPCIITNGINFAVNETLKLYDDHSDGLLIADNILVSGKSRPTDVLPPAEVGPRTALLPDYYSRDMCVSGADLSYKAFDPRTGDLTKKKNILNGAFDLPRVDGEKYDASAVGLVTGSKPFYGTCMATIDTPKIDSLPTAPGNSAFAYYQNVNNAPFKASSGAAEDARTIYGTSNSYLSTTFFLGGVAGCPANIVGNTSNAQEWKEAAVRCYDYYIYSRATHPEWVMERPGPNTDDPLTKYDATKGPDLAIFNSCQPLMKASDSALIANGASPVGHGFALVLQYPNRPDLDEADYNPAEILTNSFQSRFPGEPVPAFKNLFPCVETHSNGIEGMKRVNWNTFNYFMTGLYTVATIIETVYLDLNGPLMWRHVLEDKSYNSVGGGKPSFCPNVERIIDPADPFSPRNYFKKSPFVIIPKDMVLEDAAIEKVLGELLTSIGNVMAEALEAQARSFTPEDYGYADNFGTDRDYSFLTSSIVNFRARFLGGSGDIFEMGGYSDYMNPMKLAGDPIDAYKKIVDDIAHPEVMCAIVPVDILESRRDQFHNCIMQRIGYNYATLKRNRFLEYYFSHDVDGGELREWTKPCVTRFYEHDNVENCPVNMSIQQCCRIIVKDVVPMNYLKIRTCEGLRTKRNMLFGYDHLTDTKQIVTQHGVPDVLGATAAWNALQQANFTHAMMPNWWNDRNVEKGRTVWRPIPEGKPDVYKQIEDHYNKNLPPLLPPPPPSLLPAPATYQQAYENALEGKVTVTEDAPIGYHGAHYVEVVNDSWSNEKAKVEYDLAWLENQKLTLIGCDGTEPDSYLFSKRLDKKDAGLSIWSTVIGGKIADEVAKPITEGIGEIQDLLDTTIASITKEANDAVVKDLKLYSEVWKILDDTRQTINETFAPAEEFKKAALTSLQNSQDQLNNAEIFFKKLQDSFTSPQNVLGITLEQITGAGETYAISTAEVYAKQQVLAGISFALEAAVNLKEQGLQIAEDALRDGIMIAFNKLNSLVLDGKKQADSLFVDGYVELKNKLNPTEEERSQGKVGVVDKLIKAAMDVANAAGDGGGNLGALLGSGGAHMPYMRWWDTGTSAGNPVHGGSFINTLGSYDTIIGVGHEAREISDVVTVKTLNKYGAEAGTKQDLDSLAHPPIKEFCREVKDATWFPGKPWADSHDTYNSWKFEINLDRDISEDDWVAYFSKFAHDGNDAVLWDNGNPVTNKVFQLDGLNVTVLDKEQKVEPAHWTQYYDGNDWHNDEWIPEQVLYSKYHLKVCSNTNPADLEAALLTKFKQLNPDSNYIQNNKVDINLPPLPQQPLTSRSRMARIEGWEGLKGHQMWTTRRWNLACIGRYEKLFKPGGAEDFVLSRAGANYTSKTGVQWSWPLGWRGYVNSPDNDFEKNSTITGLDNAQKGDIVIFKANTSGLKQIAYVSEVNQGEPRFVQIESWDQGKFPTSTGSGASWGNGVTRTIYKDKVPEAALNLKDGGVDQFISRADAGVVLNGHAAARVTPAGKQWMTDGQPSCEDPDFTSCVLGAATTWDAVTVYRPSEDTNYRMCPLLDYSNHSKNVQTSRLATNSFAFCVNAGFDPPAYYLTSNGYRGAKAGAIFDTTLCGPDWTECTTAAKPADVLCFPGGGQCKSNGTKPFAPPTAQCDDIQAAKAREDYNLAYSAAEKLLLDAQTAVEKAEKDSNDAAAAYGVYLGAKAKELVALDKIIANATFVEPNEVDGNGVPIDSKALIDNAISALEVKANTLNTESVTLSAAKNNYDNYYIKGGANDTAIIKYEFILAGAGRESTPQQQCIETDVVNHTITCTADQNKNTLTAEQKTAREELKKIYTGEASLAETLEEQSLKFLPADVVIALAKAENVKIQAWNAKSTAPVDLIDVDTFDDVPPKTDGQGNELPNVSTQAYANSLSTSFLDAEVALWTMKGLDGINKVPAKEVADRQVIINEIDRLKNIVIGSYSDLTKKEKALTDQQTAFSLFPPYSCPFPATAEPQPPPPSLNPEAAGVACEEKWLDVFSNPPDVKDWANPKSPPDPMEGQVVIAGESWVYLGLQVNDNGTPNVIDDKGTLAIADDSITQDNSADDLTQYHFKKCK